MNVFCCVLLKNMFSFQSLRNENITYQFISIDEINRIYAIASNKVNNPARATVAVVEFAG
jgi:hypothetical protein